MIMNDLITLINIKIINLHSECGLLPPGLVPGRSPLPDGVVSVGGGSDGEGGGVAVEGHVGDTIAQGK